MCACVLCHNLAQSAVHEGLFCVGTVGQLSALQMAVDQDASRTERSIKAHFDLETASNDFPLRAQRRKKGAYWFASHRIIIARASRAVCGHRSSAARMPARHVQEVRLMNGKIYQNISATSQPPNKQITSTLCCLWVQNSAASMPARNVQENKVDE